MAYDILFSRDESISFADVWINQSRFNALSNHGKSGTTLGSICEMIGYLDPTIRQTECWDEANQVIIVYGCYENGNRIGGHGAAAINQGNGRFRIYNGLYCNSVSVNLIQYGEALNSIRYDESTGTGWLVEGFILYH